VDPCLTFVVRKFPATPQRILMEVFISSVRCIMLLAFPYITMPPSSLIIFEIRRELHSVVGPSHLLIKHMVSYPNRSSSLHQSHIRNCPRYL
jgi:hypothetical protein